MCLQVKAAELYHFGLIPVPSSNPPLRSINCVLPSHLCGTLYPSPKGISLCTSKGANNREMIALALQLKSFPDQRIKVSYFVVGHVSHIRHYTLFYLFRLENQSGCWYPEDNAATFYYAARAYVVNATDRHV